jgi:nucleoside-diphosphate-sugar epimerase
MTSRDTLKEQLKEFKSKHGRWDVVVHAAGATKCLRKEDFDLHNFQCTKNLVDLLIELDMQPDSFVYVSSLSILGPLREQMVAPHSVALLEGTGASGEFVGKYTVRDSVYEQMTEFDQPMPNTAYGESKLKSENYLHSLAVELETSGRPKFPYVIFRPTGVYGPRELDYALMAKSIRQHIDFAVGYKPQEITFVYVQDLVDAIYAAVDKGVSGRTYFVSDGFVYTSRSFSDLIQRELGVKHVLHITAPLWVLRCVSAVAERFARLFGKTSTLNGDKYKIMKQRNWQCDITPLQKELGFTPQWNLERGVKACAEWYKSI